MDAKDLGSMNASTVSNCPPFFQSIRQKITWLGPAIVMAGASIGVSHVVQASRAGADFGMQLLILVVLANVLKYPFFGFGHRYYAATGEHLLAGYKRLHPGVLVLFLILNIIN